MHICIFGKYPPIQGGVSMRTYWAAHGLAQLGHTVHVITNAKEVDLPYRMYMREEDWALCDGQYGSGSVQVHWTESYGQRQWHIPNGAPFITKMTSIGLQLAERQSLDVIYSHYVEPYCIAGHFLAQAKRLPHVVRTAGTDAGRLWRLPQFSTLYSHIFTSADAVVCGPTVARQMIEAGVKPARIAIKPERHVNLVELFTQDGPVLDVAALRDQILKAENDEFRSSLFGEFDPSLTYVGVFGKLGKFKGTHALLAALKRLKERGMRVGLLAMAHGHPGRNDSFREYINANDLGSHVFQLPFLPHWRVPEFIRRCAAVCCLEQEFPIKFHDPIIAREVLTCGGCLIGSTEVIEKLPDAHKLIDGYNCVSISDVNKIGILEHRITSILEDPDSAQQIRRRARQYGVEVEGDNTRWLESILCANGRRDMACSLQYDAGTEQTDKYRNAAVLDGLVGE